MRFLHTSDWHLGRSFHREDLLGAQAAFVDHLIAAARAERVDAVLIAGDVYDRALPPVDAVSLCNEALARMLDLGVRVVLISGNHDSAQRLGFGSVLFDAVGVHLRTHPAGVGNPVMIGDAAVYAIPYLEPELVRRPWGLDERSHSAALGHAMNRIRTDIHVRGAPSVVVAHAFVTGGAASDSERDISVGGVAHVPLPIFDGVGYTALGHLHGRQTLAEGVRYSGSPVAYSFSEARQVKGSWLVDIGSTGVTAAEFLAAPVPRPLARVKGTLDALLTDGMWARYEDHWLQVTLTDAVRPKAAMERLRSRFPHALVLTFAPTGAAEQGSWAQRMKDRSDTDIALDFVSSVRGEAADAAEERLLREAFEAARAREVAA